MKKIFETDHNIKLTKELLETTGSKSFCNDGLWPTHVGIDLATGPDMTVIQCGACGWCGEPKDMNRDKDGMTSCPECKKQWVNGA